MINISKQKYALKKNQGNLEVIYEDYWKHETYLHGNEMRKRFLITTKEIQEKYNIDSQQELTFLLLLHKKDYAGTCIFCKNDYYNYEIRSGNRSTYCGCTGICKKCNQPHNSSSKSTICNHCSWEEHFISEKKKENEKDNFNFIAFHADVQGLMFYSQYADIENVMQIMKKRLKFLQSYLKIRNLK